VLGGLGVMTLMTKGCRPARMMVAVPVPMATATEDAQAESALFAQDRSAVLTAMNQAVTRLYVQDEPDKHQQAV
jgi:hypothetical protein